MEIGGEFSFWACINYFGSLTMRLGEPGDCAKDELEPNPWLGVSLGIPVTGRELRIRFSPDKALSPVIAPASLLLLQLT